MAEKYPIPESVPLNPPKVHHKIWKVIAAKNILKMLGFIRFKNRSYGPLHAGDDWFGCWMGMSRVNFDELVTPLVDDVALTDVTNVVWFPAY